MVAHSGTSVRADRLRPLNAPRRIRVEADERGYPAAVYQRRGSPTRRRGERERGRGESPRHPVSPSPRRTAATPIAEVLDRWRIDDEWWRVEVSRMYFHLVLENGQLLTIFHDLVGDGWYEQTTASPLQKEEPVDVLVPGTPTVAPAPASAAPIPTRRAG